MRLYLAGSSGGGGALNEAALFAAGARNRLVSYYDLDPEARTDGSRRGGRVEEFWIMATPEKRDADLRLYIAGNGKSPGSSQRDHDTGARNRLLSYAFKDDWAKEEFQYWIERHPPEVSVLLDSGAFTAWRMKRAIDFDKYCEYLEQHRAALAAYIVLDVIGDIAGTEANLKAMRARGLDPLPVYHSDREPLSVWEKILDENTGYVCLGGLALLRPTSELLRYRLHECWRVVEKRYWPVKVHGLGVLTQWMLEEFPFYSVDGSSAIVGAGMGRVQRFEGTADDLGGRLRADGWREDFARTLDGDVADGVGRKAASGKSDSSHEGRRIRNIQAQLALERHVTELWEKRGVTWD